MIIDNKCFISLFCTDDMIYGAVALEEIEAFHQDEEAENIVIIETKSGKIYQSWETIEAFRKRIEQVFGGIGE